MYYVYVIQNEIDEFYIGYSNNPVKRLERHNNGENISTRNHQWKLVYYEAYVSEKYARSREEKLKRNRKTNQFLMSRIKESLKN